MGGALVCGMSERKTYYVMGEVDDGDGAVAIEEVIHARTQADACSYMRLVYPGLDIVEIHRLDDDG